MNQERRPCRGVYGRACLGAGYSRRPGPCVACSRTCRCGAGKGERAETCKACSGTLVVKTLVCVDCGEPKKSAHGERCRRCVAEAARGKTTAERTVQMDDSLFVAPARRDLHDRLALVLALPYRPSLIERSF